MDQSVDFHTQTRSGYGSGPGGHLHRRAGIRPRLRLAALCAYAKDFLGAAKSAQPLQGTCGPARLYLLCQALELTLTAYLVAHGDDALETVSDLETLWYRANSYGFDSLVHLTRTARTNLRKAASYYSAGAMQRPALAEILNGSAGAPDFDTLRCTVATVLAAVSNLVNTVAFQGFDKTRGH